MKIKTDKPIIDEALSASGKNIHSKYPYTILNNELTREEAEYIFAENKTILKDVLQAIATRQKKRQKVKQSMDIMARF